jgi:hypothetical protein
MQEEPPARPQHDEIYPNELTQVAKSAQQAPAVQLQASPAVATRRLPPALQQPLMTAATTAQQWLGKQHGCNPLQDSMAQVAQLQPGSCSKQRIRGIRS